MKKRIITTLSALALVSGIGVMGATAAQADVSFGPFNTEAACAQSQRAYMNAGWTLVYPCNLVYISGNTWKWFFKAIHV